MLFRSHVWQLIPETTTRAWTEIIILQEILEHEKGKSRCSICQGKNSKDDEFSNELTQYGEATLNFVCDPRRFYKDSEQAVTVTNGDKLYNFTRFTANPLIHIEGSGTVTVAIGGKTISATVTDYINIDCETMSAYRLATENKNSLISGDFPQILAGSNTVGITGTTTKVTVTPRYFTI